ncbi:nuclear transport factor 2 family protein [Pedobacter cryophilus]|uniref:Nuclear transport factor 2 family protein n=1 Tax=Pedobacter cryophilus TaxID=2571271 RepID=A0A4U1C8F4_9SPHI|nr:nuclear transport factor 2 family protein [Pedobacter cryophilus]TKC00974.1 nuclear transport factor 2 family protein [Pedobacter cryophilus]
MKKVIVFALLAMTLSYTALAQTKDEKVSAAVELLKQAMISGNQADLENIAATQLQYGHSSGKLEDKASFVKSIASGASDFVTIDLSEQTIKVTGKVAVVRHKLMAKTNDSGKPGEVKLGIMLVFAKEKGDWKLLARQAYKI